MQNLCTTYISSACANLFIEEKGDKRITLSNQIEELEIKLDDMNGQKHKLFMLLKTVLAEEERKKQIELAEKKLMEQKRYVSKG